MPPQQYGPPPGPYPGWPPAGPPKKSNGLKWALVGVALIAVIAVAVAVTATVLRSDSGSGGRDKGGSSSTSDTASADDTGPVGVITAEPTCGQFAPINNALAAQEKKGWSDRDPSIPATDWSSDQRTQYEQVGAAMRNAADQFVTLAKQTPHRVVRELYEQSIAYARAYADSIPTYTARDNGLVRVFIGTTGVIVGMCDAITYGSAGARSILATPAPTPSQTAPLGDASKPTRSLTAPDPICSDWIATVDEYNANLADWATRDTSIPATEWTPDQKAVNEHAAEVMLSNSDKTEEFSRRSTNPIVQDFLNLSAQYKRVYAEASPTYVIADAYIANTGNMAGAAIYEGCQAAKG